MRAACGRQFSLNNLFFTYNDPITFVICQWQRNRKRPEKLYLIYRVYFAGAFLVILIIDIIDLEQLGYSAKYKAHRAKWPIYMTHWGYVACTFQAIVSAVMISVTNVIPLSQEKALKLYKMYWASNIIATDLAFGITTIFWIFIYDNITIKLTAMTMLLHAFNSILMMIDLFMVSHPVRLLHCCYSVVVAIFYIVFSIIYYFAGGTDIHGKFYIYPILDWNKPGTTVFVCIGITGLLVVLHIITWGLYKARERLHQRLFEPNQEKEHTSSTAVA